MINAARELEKSSKSVCAFYLFMYWNLVRTVCGEDEKTVVEFSLCFIDEDTHVAQNLANK